MRLRSPFRFRQGISAGLLALLASASSAQIADSASFVLSQTTLAGGGQSATSPSYIVGHSTGQESIVGIANSASFELESGFWTSATINRQISLRAAGNGTGRMSGSSFDCTATAGAVAGDCEQAATHGTTVQATALADVGQFFTGWSGCDSLSTTNQDNDTCAVVASRDVTATAAFIASGSLGDRVWLDYDGDGVQDADEPGIAGVEVTLSEGASPDAARTTDSSGLYAFEGLFPDRYRLRIDPATLPPGTVPSFDPDGIATPFEADIDVLSGLGMIDADFGVQPLADLEIDLAARSIDERRVAFDVTVTNLGLATATRIVVAISPDNPASLLSTLGCQEDPSGVPNCSLGDLAAGTSTGFELQIAAPASGSPRIGASLTVSAREADPVPANNSASAGFFAAIPVPALDRFGTVLLVLILLALAIARTRPFGRP